MNSNHLPVMPIEVEDALQPKPGAWYIDATFGSGGHSRELLAAGAHVLGFDWDKNAIDEATENFASELATGNLILVRENFDQLQDVVRQLQEKQQVGEIRGILYDFGTSTQQLMSAERGFSFSGTGILDMRMDTRLGITAADILNAVPEKQLASLFEEQGGESHHYARAIAKAIKASTKAITTTDQLAELVIAVKGQQQGKLHPATKVFQALRIAVNSELDAIAVSLPQALEVVAPGGKIVTIAFHEGEDRLVKTRFNAWEKAKQGKQLSKKVLKPSEREVLKNPRSRSAKMRVFAKSNK